MNQHPYTVPETPALQFNGSMFCIGRDGRVKTADERTKEDMEGLNRKRPLDLMFRPNFDFFDTACVIHFLPILSDWASE